MKRLLETERKLREALNRLLQDRPIHPNLQQKPVQLSIANLSREAGVSRNCIYQNHRDILQELKLSQEKRSGTNKKTPADKISELRTVTRKKDKVISQIATACNEYLLQIRRLESENKRLKSRNTELIKTLNRNPSTRDLN